MLQANPATYDQYVAFSESKKLVREFLRRNSMLPVTVVDWKGDSKRTWFGYYWERTGTVHVHVARTMLGGKSFLGHAEDNTAPGVVTHEVGHHVWVCLSGGLAYNEEWSHTRVAWRSVLCHERSVSEYEIRCRDDKESFAEAVRLLILNPDLLQVGRPLRYEFLTGRLGLQPVVNECWETVLKFAPSFIINEVKDWIRAAGSPAG